ncbi:MAG: hypothetical protein NUV74_07880, partial [Candidatus Brocadiaceae bacterium]|nr:hypothetical protein [Candidatus Brocadiaceae bacterium]
MCQSGTGCHSGCSFVSLGTITTDGSGKGKFKYKGPAKFAGTIHFDICAGTTSGCTEGRSYFSGIFAAASDELIEA